jgi:hypothetical protein
MRSPQIRDKPVLFVDIDGVVSLLRLPSDSRPAVVGLNFNGVIHLSSATTRRHLLRSGAVRLVRSWRPRRAADEQLRHS